MSAKVIYYAACSADGQIAAADGGVGWLDSFGGGEEADYGYGGFFASIDKLVMGRRTFDQVQGFGVWPYQEKECWIFSQRPLDQPPPGVERFDGSPRQWVDSLASDREDRVWLVGGGALAAAFASAGLIDEYLIFQMPCLLGRGVPLLGDEGASLPSELQKLTLLECHRYDDGVLKLRYKKEPSHGASEADVH